MLAGGTGAAPFMHSLVATLLADPEDTTQLHPVVSHREPQTRSWTRARRAGGRGAGRLRVHHTFSRVTEPAAPPRAR